MVGVGAIGTVFAAPLCAAGRHEVVLCVREPFERLRVESASGVLETPARCLTDPKEAKLVDWILLAVKGHQTEGAAGWLRSLAGPKTRIAVLQNGVEHVDRVRPYVNGSPVVPCVVNCPADRVGPGYVVRQGRAQLSPPDDETGRALAELYEGTEIPITPRADITTALWTKLCMNIAGGPITALTGRGRGVLRREDVADLARGLVAECAAAGRAAGALLPKDIHLDAVARLQKNDPEATTSMLVDRLSGRPLEADAMTGAVLRSGARHGVDTPLTRHVHALLSAVHRSD